MAAALLAATGCGPTRPPPPELRFDGLPVSGNLAMAQQAGFTRCVPDNVSMRCWRTGVRLLGQGPFGAAVDMVGSDGAGGFDQISLWHDSDQMAVHTVGAALKRQGWAECRTGQEERGDKLIYTKAGAPVRVSIEISYWSKRLLRVMPERGQPTGRCW